jgi:hypothetical protein
MVVVVTGNHLLVRSQTLRKQFLIGRHALPPRGGSNVLSRHSPDVAFTDNVAGIGDFVNDFSE